MLPITRHWVSSHVTSLMTRTCGVHNGSLHQPLASPFPHHQDVVSQALPLLPCQSPSRLLPTWSRYGPSEKRTPAKSINDWRYTYYPINESPQHSPMTSPAYSQTNWPACIGVSVTRPRPLASALTTERRGRGPDWTRRWGHLSDEIVILCHYKVTA